MKIEVKSVLFIVLGVGLLVVVAEWSHHRWLREEPELSDFTKQVKNKREEHKRYLEITSQNEKNIQEDESDLEKEYILVSKDIKTEEIGNQAPHVEKYSIIFPSKNKTLITAGKNERQKKINSYKNSLSDSLYVFEMSKMFEGSGDVETSPTPEGSGDTETSPTDVPEISTTLEGSGDIETSPTTEGSEDTETTPTNVPKISTTLEGTWETETSFTSLTEVITTPEGYGESETTLSVVTEIYTTLDGSGDIETSSTTEVSGDTETTLTVLPEISTTPEGTKNIDTTVSLVTEIFTTQEADIDTTPTGLPGTYTTPESSTDDSKITPTTIPEGSGDIETSTSEPDILTSVLSTETSPKSSGVTDTTVTGDMETTELSATEISTTPDFYTTQDNSPESGTTSQTNTGLVTTGVSGDSKSTHQTVTMPVVSVSSIGTFTISQASVVTGDTGHTEGSTDSSTGKRSTALVTTVDSGKSSTIQLTSSVNVNVNATQTPGDLSTPYVTTSKGSEGTTLTSSTESSKVNTGESQFSTIITEPTAKTTGGAGESHTTELLISTTGSGSSVSSIISESASSLTKTQPLPPEPSNSTILESSKPSTSAPRTTIFPTTVEILTTKITAKPNVPTIQPCQNGGVHDGIKCICLINFYGTFCEQILDRVGIGPSISTTIKVIVRFIHLLFHNNMKDENSNEYKKFDTDFKKDMNVVYKNVPGFKDVKILSISNGSVVVDYDVIIEIEFKSNINVTQQYKDAIKDVEEGLNSIVCNSPDLPISNCISDEFQITETDNLKNEDELCYSEIPTGFQDFFESKVDGTGLVCVSQCDSMSSKYTNCQDGSCQIVNTTGPHCLCPRTDLYIYTSSNCNGRILKSGVYGGVGAAIAVLIIIICAVVVFFIRKKKSKKWDPFANDEEQSWYNDKEEDWHVGINNLSENIDNEGQDSSKDSLSFKREKFTPNLENIDTTFEVKIQRPEVTLS